MGKRDMDQGGGEAAMLHDTKEDKEEHLYDGIQLQPNPEATAGICSRIFFWFMTPLFILGYRKNLESSDMFAPLPEQESRIATEHMAQAWEREKAAAKAKGRDPSLFRSVFVSNWKELCSLGILLFIEEITKIIQPLCMGRLIRYFRFDTPLTTQDAYLSAAGVAISACVIATIHHPYFYGLQKIGMKMKVAASGMIAEKGFRLSSAAIHKVSVGHVINLLSTDVMKFDTGFMFVHYLWISPILLFAYVSVIWSEIGVASLAGFGGFIVLFPIQGYFSRQMGVCKRLIAERTDKRISIMNEVLNGIRLIKMYAWEDAFSKTVGDLRRKEMNKVRWNAVYQSMVMGLFWPCGKLVVLFAALCYVYTGNDLTAERIFVASALYNSCRLPLMLFLPFGIQLAFELRVSCRRIQDFLTLEEYNVLAIEAAPEKKSNGHLETDLDETIDDGNPKTPLHTPAKKERREANGHPESTPLIEMVENGVMEMKENWANVDNTPSSEPEVVLKSLTTCWSTNTDEESPSFAIKNVTLNAHRGQLIGIVGPVGCGKSSLLASILRETRRIDGNLTIKGTIAYCSQEAWIFGGTIRENILFGREMDQERYDKAVEFSSLLADLDQIPFGDKAIVGDRGTSLSGGQRARVALARAIYSDADIYLLDDPLSAVDAHVGRYLFDTCISKFLRNRIVILVTHQLQFLGQVDQIFLMKGGEVVASGSPKELKDSHSKLVKQVIQEVATSYMVRTSESSNTSLPDEMEDVDDETFLEDAFEKEGKLAKSTSVDVPEKEKKEEKNEQNVDEDKAEGSVPWSVYWKYMVSMCSNPILLPPALIIVIVVQLLFNATDYWLNKWTNAAELAAHLRDNGTIPTIDQYNETIDIGTWKTFDLHLVDYQNVFTILTVTLFFFSVARCLWIRLVQTIASDVLHNNMFHSIVNTGIEFFEKNPVGRILNRFSKDVHTMDEALAFVFFEFIMGVLSIFGVIAMIIIVNPYVLLVTAPLCLLFFFIRDVYLSSSRDVKRLEAVSRSPLYTHISAVMSGLMTVRAYGNVPDVMKSYHEKMNVNSAAFLLGLSTSRWFAIQIDWIVAMFVSIVAFACVISPAVLSSGEVALMLVYAVQLTGFFSWIMRQSAELQNGMVSLERIINYSELPSEFDEETKTQVPANWPVNGIIKFDQLSLKYDPEGEMILKNLSFSINGKEKIGIVGRTGAGKSSLLRAIFRLTRAFSGRIFIDGVDISTIPLKTLRRCLAIIPQEPVLFVGTVRYNIDPFGEHADEQLWDALSQVKLKEAISQLSGGLDASMQEGGSNFSVGQRQLVCLARAILRKAKILVIDEATANVDQHTDNLIQATIRNRFRDSTVLTIAHRLNTIMDSDRILVMGDGEMKEFDSPYNLLQNEDSILTSLVEETGKESAANLRNTADLANGQREAERP